MHYCWLRPLSAYLSSSSHKQAHFEHKMPAAAGSSVAALAWQSACKLFLLCFLYLGH